MRYIRTILILYMLGLTSCGLFQASPNPCQCEQVKADLYQYAEDYAMCLEDNGNLRAQLWKSMR